MRKIAKLGTATIAAFALMLASAGPMLAGEHEVYYITAETASVEPGFAAEAGQGQVVAFATPDGAQYAIG